MKKQAQEIQKCTMIINLKNGGKDVVYFKSHQEFFTLFQLLVHENWPEILNVYFATEDLIMYRKINMLDISPKSSEKYLITAQKNEVEFDYFLTNRLIDLFQFIQLRLKAGPFLCTSFKIYFNN